MIEPIAEIFSNRGSVDAVRGVPGRGGKGWRQASAAREEMAEAGRAIRCRDDCGEERGEESVALTGPPRATV